MMKPLKPDENKRDWFLFHMTPLGMVSEETKTQETDIQKPSKAIIFGAAILILLLMVWAFN